VDVLNSGGCPSVKAYYARTIWSHSQHTDTMGQPPPGGGEKTTVKSLGKVTSEGSNAEHNEIRASLLVMSLGPGLECVALPLCGAGL